MTETIPPRLVHNESLAKKWLKDHGIVSTCPPVHDQIESVIIDRKAIFKNGYNPSIIRHQGRLLMAYRYYPTPGNPATQLAVAELDEQFNVKKNEKVQVNAPAQAYEDCRLFLFKDQLYASYVEVKTPPTTIIVKYGLLVEGSPWRIVDIQQPDIGTNNGKAYNKNFLFWDQGGKLMCIYESYPDQIVFDLHGSEAVNKYLSTASQWPYGQIKGGAGPVPHEGKLLRFFHSTLDNEPGDWPRRYYLGYCLMETTPPFRVVAIGKEPIAKGSEICDLSETERNATFNYKPNVLFPAGIITVDGGWWVSSGINDSSNVLLKIKPSDLHL